MMREALQRLFWLRPRLPLHRVVAAFLVGCLSLQFLFADDGVFRLSPKALAAVEAKFGTPARSRLAEWVQLMSANRARSEREKLELANDFFNRIPFVSDEDHWGKQDYWATPAEMLVTNGGDCEDFAIGKYFTLVQLGVPVGKLRITYVKARNWNPVNQAHMVLTYYPTPDAVPLVLDNLMPEIKPASQRPDLVPVYSFNGDGLWLARERGSGKAVGTPANISPWRDMMSRLGKEFE